MPLKLFVLMLAASYKGQSCDQHRNCRHQESVWKEQPGHTPCTLSVFMLCTFTVSSWINFTNQQVHCLSTFWWDYTFNKWGGYNSSHRSKAVTVVTIIRHLGSCRVVLLSAAGNQMHHPVRFPQAQLSDVSVTTTKKALSTEHFSMCKHACWHKCVSDEMHGELVTTSRGATYNCC